MVVAGQGVGVGNAAPAPLRATTHRNSKDFESLRREVDSESAPPRKAENDPEPKITCT